MGRQDLRDRLGRRLRLLRTDANLTQRELGEKLGLNKSRVNKLENGKADMKVLELERICQLFSRKIQELLPRE